MGQEPGRPDSSLVLLFLAPELAPRIPVQMPKPKRARKRAHARKRSHKRAKRQKTGHLPQTAPAPNDVAAERQGELAIQPTQDRSDDPVEQELQSLLREIEQAQDSQADPGEEDGPDPAAELAKQVAKLEHWAGVMHAFPRTEHTFDLEQMADMLDKCVDTAKQVIYKDKDDEQ